MELKLTNEISTGSNLVRENFRIYESKYKNK